jgi:hypothetical protein
MAKKYRRRKAARKNPARRARTRVIYRSKARNARRSHRRRRNSNLGAMGGGGIQTAKLVLGGLVGVTLTKMLAGMIRRALPAAGSAPILSILTSGVAAWLLGKAGSRIDAKFGDAMAFGGYMQTGSDALSAFVPGIGLGLGAIVPGRFAVPENVIMRGQAAAALPVANGGGVSGYNRSARY